MSSSTVRLEVLPVANKLRYEKSLIGQLFNNTEPTTVVPKVKSPFLVHKLRPSNASTPSPEPPASQTPPLKEEEFQPARHTPVESNHRRQTPSPPISASPTLKDRSESPAPKKTPALATVVDMINKKPGKKMKIDLKKGKLDVKSNFFHFSSDQFPGELKKAKVILLYNFFYSKICHIVEVKWLVNAISC